MGKKRFFARAFAFAALTGLMAFAPSEAEMQKVQGMEDEVIYINPDSSMPWASSGYDIVQIVVQGSDGSEVVDTTYEFTRTAKDTITVVRDGGRDAYYRFEDEDDFVIIENSITIPVRYRNEEAIILEISLDDQGEDSTQIYMPPALSAEVNYSNYTLEITPSCVDSFVFVEVLKKKNDTKAGTIYTYSWSEMSDYNENIIVDLSFLKVNKESYLRVWGDRCSGKLDITVNPQPAKEKLKYNAAAAFPEWKLNDSENYYEKFVSDSFQKSLKKYYKNSFGILSDAEYEIKGLYSSEWKDLFPRTENETEEDQYIMNWDSLASLKVAGTTVILRQKAVKQEYEGTENEDGYFEFSYDREGNKQIVEEGAPAGVEVKIKIPTSPKAPKVTIDYAKGTVKFPKNAQYGIVFNDRYVQYVDIAAGGVLTPRKILEQIADKLELKDNLLENYMERTNFIESKLKRGFRLIVRTNDSKKGVSNAAFVDVKASPVIIDDRWGKLFDGNGKEIATYEFDQVKGATLTFSSGTFEYEDGGKWKKLTSGKSIKGKTSELTVRLAGIKNKNESEAALPSEKVRLEKRKSQAGIKFADTPRRVLYCNGEDEGTSYRKSNNYTIIVTDRDGKVLSNDDLKNPKIVKSVQWSSDNKQVAVVVSAEKDGVGKITGYNPGEANITVTVSFENGVVVTDKIQITVKNK